MSESISEQSKRSRGKGGLPRIPLSQAIDIAKAVLEVGQGNSVPRGIVLSHLGRASGGGRSLQLVGASNTYGLTKLTKELLELTPEGRVIADPSSSKTDRYNAIYKVLFSSSEFEKFMSEYSNKVLPKDEFILDHFRRTYSLDAKSASDFWTTTKENLKEYELATPLKDGKFFIRSKQDALKAIAGEAEIQDEETTAISDDAQTQPAFVIPALEPQKSSQALPNQLSKMGASVPEFHFNIQIHLPSDASTEQYDAIFKSIGKHLLGNNSED